jgi:ABC-type molybdate transport system substrate-binding protein
LPDWAQPAIRYKLALVKASSNLAAGRAFVKQVVSKRGRLLLAQAGFGLPKKKK